jgi:hypothetical protein
MQNVKPYDNPFWDINKNGLKMSLPLSNNCVFYHQTYTVVLSLYTCTVEPGASLA